MPGLTSPEVVPSSMSCALDAHVPRPCSGSRSWRPRVPGARLRGLRALVQPTHAPTQHTKQGHIARHMRWSFKRAFQSVSCLVECRPTGAAVLVRVRSTSHGHPQVQQKRHLPPTAHKHPPAAISCEPQGMISATVRPSAVTGLGADLAPYVEQAVDDGLARHYGVGAAGRRDGTTGPRTRPMAS